MSTKVQLKSGTVRAVMAKDKIIVKEAICGWCQTGMHKVCAGTTQRFYIGWVGKEKGKVVLIEKEYNSCNCPSKHARPDVRNNKPIEDLEAL